MNHALLNEYIKHYLEEDKTRSAIMLTAPWGTGKSYYIQNILIPFLEQKGEKRCIVVSLYGLNSISDINRSLYIEMRFKKLRSKTESQANSVILGKTVFKGVTSFLGIDITLSEEELSKLYTSINFGGRLIIFEDIERTNINIFEFLGYINNLVEQDGVKVLLVANEKELIKYVPIEFKSKEEKDAHQLWTAHDSNSNREYTDETKNYLRIKEKSISDTITYICDSKTAIKNIISLFENQMMSTFTNNSNLDEIINIFNDIGERNLRSFLFVCQKTADIFKQLNNINDDEFIKCIFFGNLTFILKMRRGEQQIWTDKKSISYTLGSDKYPLFKFCYDFIVNHIISQSNIDKALEEFLEAKLYDMKKSNSDKDLNTIFSFHTKEESDIIKAISNIEKRLSDINDISFYCYGTLSNYLICLTQFIDYDISNCLRLLIDNLKGRGAKITGAHLFRSTIAIDDNQKKEEFEQQKQLMISAINQGEDSLFDFNYDPKNVTVFCKKVYSEQDLLLSEKSFIKRLNSRKFVDMIYKCTANDINYIRQMFGHVYDPYYAAELFSSDRESLIELVKRLKEHEIPKDFDKIQLMQRDYLINNLERYIEYLA